MNHLHLTYILWVGKDEDIGGGASRGCEGCCRCRSVGNVIGPLFEKPPTVFIPCACDLETGCATDVQDIEYCRWC